MLAEPHLHLTGASPLTRGKHRIERHSATRSRRIPAHAGKTCSSPPSPRAFGAHPRSRGENGLLLRGVDKSTGASPLTRGKHRELLASNGFTGRIPAHAGKTAVVSLAVWVSGAHPRSRGENTS